jgi:RNA 3'-terminal phosphate cyclase (ATP)
MPERLLIDGAYGEGGGQILRTAITLAAITGRPVGIENIRANRPNPGLAAQHVTAVRAVAEICRATVTGVEIGSQAIDFAPGGPPDAGTYSFDVAAARQGGSAGATTLVAAAVVPPLSLTAGESTVTIRGGTHMAWSPPFDYMRDVWLPALAQIGIDGSAELSTWGWFPAGGGEIHLTIHGRAATAEPLMPLTLTEPGKLRRISGRAVAANLPAHIPQRMVDRARALLPEAALPVNLVAERVRAKCPGAGIFLIAEYDAICCGFSALGEVGKPSETVAEEAVDGLRAHQASGAALDIHLADQILLPLAFAGGISEFTVPHASRHLETNAHVIEQFGVARIALIPDPAGVARVRVVPQSTLRNG